MSTLLLSAKLNRADGTTPWGFRMHGGKDFGAPLTIQRVTPGSLGANCGLKVGDNILRIGDFPVDLLTHKEAQAHIMGAGNFLELTLQRRATIWDDPSDPQTHGNLKSSGSPAPPRSPMAAGRAYSPSPLATGQPAFQPSHSPTPQDHNRSAAPFPNPGNGNIPMAVNSQYNTPINMYSVDNTMNTLAAQTGAMHLGAPSQDPIPPWRTGPSQAPAGRLSPAVPARAASPRGLWQPQVPTGPRKMRFIRPSEVRSMPSAGVGVKVPICDSCGIAIRGPFVLALNKSWCPDHFNCSNPHCRAPLIGIGFVEEAGQLFCEKDYEKYFAPRCGKCGNAIMRECVNALKDTFHPECFLCFHCGGPIGSGSFHVEDGKNYCEKDWAAMFQTKCYGCQFPIEPGDRWVEALNANWHSECFNCSTCQVNLEGQGFYAKDGKPYCKKHASTKRF